MPNDQPRKQVISLIGTIQIATEEILGWLPEDLSIGDDGVAEAIIDIENSVSLIQLKFQKRGW